MVRIEGKRAINKIGEKMVAVLDLQVSSVDKLPALGSTVAEYVVAEGSIAQIIQPWQFATLEEDGKWYADGEEIG